MENTKRNILAHIEKRGWTPLYRSVDRIPIDHGERDQEDVEFDLWKTQVRFLKEFKRITYNLEDDSLLDIMRQVDNEDERKVEVRVDMNLKDLELPEIWTRYGKLDMMCVIKPEREEDFGDLREWQLCMVFLSHQRSVIHYDVASAIGVFDHILAWYALWRKWPVQYTEWEWCVDVWNYLSSKESWSKFLDYGYSGVYRTWWTWAEGSITRFPICENDVNLEGEDYECPWEMKLYEQRGDTYIPKLKRRRLDIER